MCSPLLQVGEGSGERVENPLEKKRKIKAMPEHRLVKRGRSPPVPSRTLPLNRVVQVGSRATYQAFRNEADMHTHASDHVPRV